MQRRAYDPALGRASRPVGEQELDPALRDLGIEVAGDDQGRSVGLVARGAESRCIRHAEVGAAMPREPGGDIGMIVAEHGRSPRGRQRVVIVVLAPGAAKRIEGGIDALVVGPIDDPAPKAGEQDREISIDAVGGKGREIRIYLDVVRATRRREL